jgi:PAS domain S-box-containing protein
MNFTGFLDRAGNLLVRDGKKNWPAIALLYIMIVLPILFLAAYSSLRAHQDLTRLVWSQRLDLAYLTAATLQEKLHRLTELGVSLTSRARFRQSVSDGQWDAAIQSLSNVPRDFPFIERAFLADLHGTLMADFPAVSEVRGQNFAARDWYRGVSGNWRPYISDVYQRAAAPRLNVIAAAIPVKLDDGRPIAILVLQVKLDSMVAWIKDVDVGAEGTILVIDKRGQLVARPDDDLQSEIQDFSSIPAVQKALHGHKGVDTFVDRQGTDELLLAYSPVTGYGWGVVVQQPARIAYGARDRGSLFALANYGVAILLNCTLAYLILGILIRVKKAEESYSQLAAIVESSDDAILSKSLDGDIVTWNRGAERIYGYSEQEAKGSSIDLLVPGDQAGETEKILQRVRRGETVDHYETVRRRKDGAMIDVSLSVSPIRNAEGKIVAASAIGRDITQRKELRRELEEKNRILEQQYNTVREANRLKSEFLANMSHELRTPLNAIIGFAQLMHDGRVGPISPDHKEYLGDILTSGRRLLELINDVLDLARVDSGKMEFRPEPVELSQLVDQVRMIVKSIAASKRLLIESEVAPDVEQLVIDPAKLKQVLYNYLSNAIKFTPDAGRITIRARAEDNQHFRLEVADTGIGISPSQIGELFVEFKQLEAGLSKKHQGTGLGLALTKKIVEAQGGRVGVQSALGQGSLFFAVLPKRIVQSEEPSKEQAVLSVPRFRGPKVLIVEDDEHDLNWLSKTLTQAGYIVECATSGAEAMAKAQTISYNAILLDLILPDTLGWDVLQSIRNAEINRHAPVIVVTVVSEKAAAKSFALQDYLPKPVSAAALLGSLRRAGIIATGIGRNILVVDDDPEALKLAAAALESSGYRSHCHRSAASALTEAAQAPIDAVILDLLMPEMDGFEFLERLRGLAHHSETPVIIWTAKSVTIAERERLKSSASSIALKGQGGIDAVLRELRHHVTAAAQENA